MDDDLNRPPERQRGRVTCICGHGEGEHELTWPTTCRICLCHEFDEV